VTEYDEQNKPLCIQVDEYGKVGIEFYTVGELIEDHTQTPAVLHDNTKNEHTRIFSLDEINKIEEESYLDMETLFAAGYRPLS
jgi:hypothetical protein